MANSTTHAQLPYPVKGCRYTIPVPYLDADGDPLDPTTPDTEVSKDAGSFADCTEEVSTITGSNGTGYITLTGDETNCNMLAVCAKVASGPKATLVYLFPRALPVIETGTAQSGASGTITLASGANSTDGYYAGAIVATTSGTGAAGGSGSLGNQARMIVSYVGSTRVATLGANWETTPDNTTVYSILSTEFWKGTVGGSGGSSDWTSDEKTAIRSILGIPGSGTTPADPTTGILDTIRDKIDAVDDYVDTEVAAVKAVTDKLDTALELDGSVYRYTTNALEQAPSGGGGSSDWTADEKTVIKAVLGIPGSGTTPDDPSTGILDTIRDAALAVKAKTDNLPSDPADASDIASSFSTVNSTLSTISGKIDTVDDYIDTEVAAILAAVDTEVAAIKAKTDNLPSDPADASDIAAAFVTVNSKLDAIDDYVDSEIAAIKAKTDNLPSDPADNSEILAAITANSPNFYTPEFDSGFTSSSGVVWNGLFSFASRGEFVDVYAVDPTATLALSVKESTSGLELFALTATAVGSDGRWKLTKVSPAFVADRLYRFEFTSVVLGVTNHYEKYVPNHG